MRVDEAPVLAGAAPVVKGVECLEGLAVVKVEPLASATVEVLMDMSVTHALDDQDLTYPEVVIAVNNLVASRNQVLDSGTAQPGLNNDVLA